nr:hypothetical protein [Tanacetum cinerariifolium]
MWRGHFGYESDFSVLDSFMRVFVNLEMEEQALEVVRRTRGIGLQPSLSALSVLFKLLLRVGFRILAQDVLLLVVRRVGVGRGVEMMELFRDMLRERPRPSNILFNVMIHGFCRKGEVRIGESLLYLMSKFECEPDVITYNILINAYCIRGQTLDALSWVDLMVERGCSPSTATFSTIINALSKEGNIVEARNVFDWMQDMGVSLSISVYNALIDGLVKGCYKYGRDEHVNHLLRDLSMSGLLPDSSLPDVSVARLCWAGQPDEAVELLEDMLKQGLPLTVIAFNSIISAYSKYGLEKKAFDAYHMMIKFGLTPSSSTCNSLLMCLSRNGKLHEAEELMYTMKDREEFSVNSVAFTVLLDGHFKNGDVMRAQKLWFHMNNIDIAPDAVAFSAFVDGLSKAGLVDEAHDIFLEMKTRGVVPNNFTYNSLIAGFCNCRKVSKALKLEKEMRQMGLFPDIFTSNIIINGYCKQGRMKSAIDTYMDMHNFGLVPDVVTYNTLISGYCNGFDMVNANNLVYEMYNSGWDPDVTTYNIRIHGFSGSRRMNRAVFVFNELLSSGIVPNTTTYNTMLNAICYDILDRAMILTARLLKLAFVPNVVTTNLLLSHLRRQGLPERALMWGQHLRQISHEFDEITYKILERADHDIKEDAVYLRGTSGKSLFLDFLMYLTYDYLYRNKLYGETDTSAIRMINNLSSRSLEATTRIHQQPIDLNGNSAFRSNAQEALSYAEFNEMSCRVAQEDESGLQVKAVFMHMDCMIGPKQM